MTYYESKDIIIHVENLSVAYGDKVIIRDISFEEKDTQRLNRMQGQSIGFVGRSGRGKSTLFRALAGLTPLATGKILVPDLKKYGTNSGQVELKEVHEGDVGFVDQKYTLFRHKTVLQALRFAMRNTGLSAEEKEQKINKHLLEWGLEKMKGQYPNELSGGQRQRTAILEQLLSSGNLIIMDEPFSGLDVGNIESVKNAFELINSSHELNTIIFSTHDIELAIELADSLYVIGHPTLPDGSLASYGTTLRHFDLKQMGLAWHGEMTKEHHDLAKEVKEAMLKS